MPQGLHLSPFGTWNGVTVEHATATARATEFAAEEAGVGSTLRQRRPLPSARMHSYLLMALHQIQKRKFLTFAVAPDQEGRSFSVPRVSMDRALCLPTVGLDLSRTQEVVEEGGACPSIAQQMAEDGTCTLLEDLSQSIATMAGDRMRGRVQSLPVSRGGTEPSTEASDRKTWR